MTSTDRRAALRTGAGLLAGAAVTAACAPSGTGAPDSPGTGQPPAAPAADAPAAPGPRRFPGSPEQITHGPRTRARVALTFHGQGDPALARALLDTAERHGARLTVLAVGTWLDDHPEMARRVLDGGHDLGNHTQNHLDIGAMPEAEARAEITACADRLKRLTGSIGTWFRPSRAARASPLVARLAREAGYPHVLSYDVDSLDFTSPGADAVTRTVLAEVRPGSVVSLHCGYPDTVAALPAVLTALDRRGLRAVTTTELLS
ncbi:polysaccharide deacetylase family protein [Streptomyces sp. XM83C]|uniref:Polysaccharide deacetylase family protein n=1 Tax=Streptomyces thermocoprophilus TaxID=78356 RepID=A0ABV5VI23_9ACTN|nr:polysaccharide deacetylase family protein [Streptomyces sp. XM83C]MCK1818095.1 polysaccharide deacetylase family protein [Streptomyces sp. XM83C]